MPWKKSPLTIIQRPHQMMTVPVYLHLLRMMVLLLPLLQRGMGIGSRRLLKAFVLQSCLLRITLSVTLCYQQRGIVVVPQLHYLEKGALLYRYIELHHVFSVHVDYYYRLFFMYECGLIFHVYVCVRF